MSLIVGTMLLGVVSYVCLHVWMGLKALWGKWRLKQTLLSRFPGPPGHWLQGNLSLFNDMGQIVQTLRALGRRFGAVHWVQLGPLHVNLRVSDPDDIRSLLNLAGHSKGEFYRFFRPWFGNGILTSEGALWRRNRHLLTPAFHFDNLRHYVHYFAQSAARMFHFWQQSLRVAPDGVALEMFDNCSQITLDSLLKCAFGKQEGCLSAAGDAPAGRHPYVQLVSEATQLILKRMRNPLLNMSDTLYYWSTEGRRFLRVCDEMHEYTRKIITERRQYLSKTRQPSEKSLSAEQQASNSDASADSSDRRPAGLPFIDIVLLARDDHNNGLSDEEIQHEVDTFMAAGHDTTACGLSWCLYNLAKHPEEQERCRAEVQQVLEGRAPSWADLAQLQYLTWTIKESLRCIPVVPAVGRLLNTDVPLTQSGAIPKKSSVVIAMDNVHQNPELWPEPERFDPSRFSPERSVGRHPFAFIPFSAGPRNCIGQHFAMAEMKTVLAVALQRFRFEPDTSRPEPVWVPDTIVRARDGLYLKVKPLHLN